jgi:hypothetical protein
MNLSFSENRELLVMDGATALALPTRYGQKMTAKSGSEADFLH